LIKRTAILLLFGVVGGLLAWAGINLLFSTFMLYDDEGYVLLTLRDFSRHGALYDQIFTQYGPAFYLIYGALQHLLHFAWTNTTGRWITLVNWSGTTVFCTLLMWRARAAWPFVLFVLVDVFAYLWIMIQEPMHPGSTITLLVAGAAWLGWEMLRAGRMNLFAGLLGVIGALLALIKINVGVFLILSAGFWLLLGTSGLRLPRKQLGLACLGLILPALLMRALLGEPWVLTFAIIAGLAAVSVVLGVTPATQVRPINGPANWCWFVGAGLGVTAIVAGLVLARGTSLGGLWEGVIIAPLKHPGIYAFPVRWRPAVVWVALGAALLLLTATLRPDNRRLALAIAWIRVVTTLLFQIVLLPWFSSSQAAIGLCYGVPLAGLFAWPLRSSPQNAPANQARAWLAILLVFQGLHAYPVAGSQLNWGTFLWVPLMVLGLEEALDVLLEKQTDTARRLRLVVFTVVCSLTFFITQTLVQVARHNHLNNEPLELPGAEHIGMPANYSSAIRVITENARVHGDVLLSLPGAYSLNLWSGVDTPTLANVTHWFSLLTPERQQAVIARLDSSPRSLFIVQHNILASLMETGFHPKGPIMDYVYASYHRAFGIEGYSFWVRNGRSIAPLSTGTLQRTEETKPDAYRLSLTLAARHGDIARIEVRSIIGQPWLVLTLDASNTRTELTPLHLDGSTAGPARPADWPLNLKELDRVDLFFTSSKPKPPPESLEAILLDGEGRHLGTARVLASNGGERPPAPPRHP